MMRQLRRSSDPDLAPAAAPPATRGRVDAGRRRVGSLVLGGVFGSLLGGALGLAGCDRRAPAPEIGYTLLDGTRGSTGALRGRVVLVNFWATSCAPCVREMPALVATHRRFHARGLETLAVAMRHDPPAWVARFAEANALPFGVAIDNTGAIARGFGDVAVTPTTFLVDRRGQLARRFDGVPDHAALHALVERLLAEA